ncbi:hypothetical protein LWE61_15180 [Sphingobium sufflavum]|uniref:hypothetical protein n=1 Tax=Sphingobium sufflavum TaxID=1129547 RepID=UPI001F33396D|nr:hypothetical protein [Sphingobium sufflavum]MCE7797892.1 hypothetical protein [Sphingobium sufflavum]
MIQPFNLERIIDAAIRDAVDAQVDAVTEAAIADVRRRIAAQKAVIVMSALKHFDIVRNSDRLTITVRDTTQP